MNFQKFVQRSTKGLFLFIAIVMIVPLVLWGYMGRMGNEKDGDEEAGTIKTDAGPLRIVKSVFNQQKLRAYPTYYLNLYRQIPQYPIAILRGQRAPEPKPEELTKLAWRNIILLEDAKLKGIPLATETEINLKSRKLFDDMFFGRLPPSAEGSQQLFRASQPVYDAWIADLVVIDKLLETVAGAKFADYEDVYNRVMSDQQSIRVTFAGFDPKEYMKEVKPPRTDEIAKYYQDNKTRFRSPEKVVLAYLLADTDELKKNEPDPSEEAIRKYYDEHKQSEFLKPAPEHKHGPGEEHKEDEKPAPQEPKPYEEVRGEIPDKIKRNAAQEKAAALMKDLNTELGQAFVTSGNKYPENILYDLREKVEREKSMKLIHDVTTPFDRRRVEEIEKIVGSGGSLDSWAFDPKRAEGDISNIITTTKGRVFFKLQKKIAANDNPGVTAQNRESIVKELQKEQLKKRAQQQASTVVDEIKAHGIAAARVKYPVEWRSTRYFKTQYSQRGDPNADDPGIEDKTLGDRIRSHVAQGKLKAGEASVLQGSMVGGEKRDWSFVVYVDDVLVSPPGDFDAKFQETRHEMDQAARKSFEREYGDKMVLLAEVKDLNKKDASGAPMLPEPSFPDSDN